MATIASLIVEVIANTASIQRNMEDASQTLDDFSQHAVGTIAAGDALGTALEKLGELGLEAINKIIELPDVLMQLGEHGSEVDDVTQSFTRMAGGVDQATQILDQMRQGVVGTLSDFALMTDANKLLATGALTNADDFGTLATAARVLAHEGFGSITDVMATVSSAMETGRVRSLALMGVQIDQKQATLDYADSLGVTVSQLSSTGQLEAKRQAILEALQATVADAGAQELTFAEQIGQVRTNVANFTDAIGVAIATSPVVKAGMGAIAEAIQAAFGGNQVQLVQTITGYVNSFALILVDLGIGATQVATVLVAAWSAIQIPILAVEQVVVGLGADLLSLVDIAVTVASKVPGVGTQFLGLKGSLDGASEAARATASGLNVEFQEAMAGVTGNSALNASIDAVGGMLFTVRDKMIAASETNASAADIVENLGARHQQLSSVLDGGQQKLTAFQKAMLDLDNAGTSWKTTLDGIDGEVVAAVEYYLNAGVSATTLKEVYGLTEVQVKALEQAHKDYASTLKAVQAVEDSKQANSMHNLETLDQAQAKYNLQEMDRTVKEINDTDLLWTEYYDLQGKNSMTATDYQIAQIQKWYDDKVEKAIAAHNVDQSYYDGLSALADQKMQDVYNAHNITFQAILKLQQDLQGGWETTFANTLVSTHSFAGAFVAVYQQLEKDVLQVFADMLAQIIEGFLQGLLNSLSSYVGQYLAQFALLQAGTSGLGPGTFVGPVLGGGGGIPGGGGTPGGGDSGSGGAFPGDPYAPGNLLGPGGSFIGVGGGGKVSDAPGAGGQFFRQAPVTSPIVNVYPPQGTDMTDPDAVAAAMVTALRENRQYVYTAIQNIPRSA